MMIHEEEQEEDLEMLDSIEGLEEDLKEMFKLAQYH
jgi:hypothetical protein